MSLVLLFPAAGEAGGSVFELSASATGAGATEVGSGAVRGVAATVGGLSTAAAGVNTRTILAADVAGVGASTVAGSARRALSAQADGTVTGEATIEAVTGPTVHALSAQSDGIATATTPIARLAIRETEATGVSTTAAAPLAVVRALQARVDCSAEVSAEVEVVAAAATESPFLPIIQPPRIRNARARGRSGLRSSSRSAVGAVSARGVSTFAQPTSSARVGVGASGGAASSLALSGHAAGRVMAGTSTTSTLTLGGHARGQAGASAGGRKRAFAVIQHGSAAVGARTTGRSGFAAQSSGLMTVGPVPTVQRPEDEDDLILSAYAMLVAA